LRNEGGVAVYEVGSGAYIFASQLGTETKSQD
jgi:hypothetical protein